MTAPSWARRRNGEEEAALSERTVRDVLSALRLDGLPRNEQVRAIREADHWRNGSALAEDDVRLLREAGLLT